MSAIIVSKKVIMLINISKKLKKLEFILAISTLVTKNSKEAILVNAKSLEWIIYIQYPIIFQSNLIEIGKVLDLMSAFFDLDNKVNAIYPTFIEKFGFAIQFTYFDI